MFELETEDASQLKRILVAGSGALLVGLVIVLINLVVPLVAGGGYDSTNIVFGLFGIVVVMLATHPTYHAAERLDRT